MHHTTLAATRMVWLLYAHLGDESKDNLRAQASAFDDISRGLIEAGTAILISSSPTTRELAFDNVPSLLRAALGYYRGTKRACERTQPHQIRLAIHAGIAHDRNGTLEGPSLNRAMRLRSIANAGQILFSGSAHDLALGNLPAGIALRSLGAHRLKEIASPERIYQLLAPDLMSEFPPLLTPSVIPNNLVLSTSSFIGRSTELSAISEFLRRAVLVTLVGPGGAGKTRLATVAAAGTLSRFPDGVWIIELASLTDITSIPSILAFHFGVRNISDRPLLDAVLDTLKSKNALLIFDNCEHVREPLIPIIRRIMTTAPQVRILATSRIAFEIPGEHSERIGSLSTPPNDLPSPQSLIRYDAIALFIDRVKAVRPDISLTEHTLAIIARICRRLDGIPLAIELAAARASAFDLDELETMLARRFDLLVSDDKTKSPRQQTLRGLIDWSFTLLSPEQRRTFTCLSIFVGSFALRDAQAICNDVGDHFAPLLTSLVDRSLLVGALDDDAGEMRYHLLESTREYGLTHLKESNEIEILGIRHARHYATVAKEYARIRPVVTLAHWLDSIERDYENIAAAVGRSLACNDRATAAKIASRLREYWPARRPDEGRQIVAESLTDISELDVETLANLWLADALLANRLRNDRKTVESSLIATALYESGKLRTRGYITALRMRSFARTMLNDIELAEIDANLAIKISEELGDEREANRAQTQLAQALMARGEYPRASAILRQSAEQAIELGERVDVVLQDLAEAEFWAGNVAAAVDAVQRAISISLDEDPAAQPIGSFANLAAYLISLDRFDEARSPAREALRMSTILGHRYVLALAMLHLGTIAIGLGNAERGAKLIGFSDEIHRRINQEREHTEQLERNRVNRMLAEQFSPHVTAQLLANGAQLDDELAVEQALAV